MAKRELKWIELHEDHWRENLIELEPFLDCMAASSPLGWSVDPEMQVWERHTQNKLTPCSLGEFRERTELVRNGLKEVLTSVEPLVQSPAPTNGLETMLPRLQVAYTEFLALQRSPFAWQELYTGDAELLRKAAFVLWKFS